MDVYCCWWWLLPLLDVEEDRYLFVQCTPPLSSSYSYSSQNRLWIFVCLSAGVLPHGWAAGILLLLHMSAMRAWHIYILVGVSKKTARGLFKDFFFSILSKHPLFTHFSSSHSLSLYLGFNGITVIHCVCSTITIFTTSPTQLVGKGVEKRRWLWSLLTGTTYLYTSHWLRSYACIHVCVY